MQVKIKADRNCLWCNKSIKKGDYVCVYKSGAVVHQGECWENVKTLSGKIKRGDKDKR